MNKDDPSKEKQPNDKLLALARARYKEAYDVEQPKAEKAQEDLGFLTGEGHWPDKERQQREIEGKPCLVFNSSAQHVRKVTGSIRQLNPAIKVLPDDHSGDKETAEVIEGLVREIEYRCDAPSIYEAAAESAAQCGIGFFRIRNDYCDHESFNQHILIERVFNPFSVIFDPQAKLTTRADAEFVFVIAEMPRDEFKSTYPDAVLSDFTSDHKADWEGYWYPSADTVVIAEYIYKDFEEHEIALLPSGQVVKGPFPKELSPLRRRKVRKPVIKSAIISGDAILEGPSTIPGEHIPVIAVTGEEVHVGERSVRSGVLTHAKDAAVSYNVLMNNAIESALLQPRAPFVGTAEQFRGFEQFWESANRSNRAYLPYNADMNAPGAPQRVQPPVASQGFLQLAQIAAEDVKRTTGIYDASLGARSNETSGVAIKQRQQESEIATSVYADNMTKAVAQAGRVIVSMIPQVYDVERVVRILGQDAQEKLVTINQVLETMDGTTIKSDVTRGKYSVRVTVGPTYASKQQEASEGMMEFLRVVPQAAPMIADLVAGSQEWPDAERIAKRMRKGLPPNMLEDDEQDEEQDPAVMQQKQMAAEAAQKQAQMAEIAQEAELRKVVAEAQQATADAAKAQAEAELAKLQLNAARGAPMPDMIPVQPAQSAF